MNESSDERAKEIPFNAEDLGWKKRLRWPKTYSYEGVECQHSGSMPGIDCCNLYGVSVTLGTGKKTSSSAGTRMDGKGSRWIRRL